MCYHKYKSITTTIKEFYVFGPLSGLMILLLVLAGMIVANISMFALNRGYPRVSFHAYVIDVLLLAVTLFLAILSFDQFLASDKVIVVILLGLWSFFALVISFVQYVEAEDRVRQRLLTDDPS